MADYELITDPVAFARACERWQAARWIALDTEFVREETYYPQLCLVQVADATGISVVDTLALAHAMPALCAVTRSASVLKVIHAASQDLEVLGRLCGAPPAPIFDTQVAAALLGLGDQISYAALIEKRLGRTLDKSLTRTDWSRRPLTPAEMAYAADDVRYLALAFPSLQAELDERGRGEWLREECAALCDPARFEAEPADAWKRLKGIAGLPATGQACAAALAAWREATAQRRDRPRRWILADDALFAIAQRRPRSLPELERLKALPPKTLSREGDAILQALAAVPEQAQALVAGNEPLSDEQKRSLSDWQAKVRGLAEQLGVPAPMLASRAELERLVRAGGDATRVLREGWRGRVSAPLFEGG